MTSAGSRPVLLIFHFRKIATFSFRLGLFPERLQLVPAPVLAGPASAWVELRSSVVALGLCQNTSPLFRCFPTPLYSGTDFMDDTFKCKQNSPKLGQSERELGVVCLYAEG